MKKNKNKAKEKFNWKILLAAIPAILTFAVIIERNIDIPLPVIIILGTAAIGFLLLISLKRPEWVFYILIAYIPFSKVLVGGFGREVRALNMTNILIIITVIGWLINSLGRGGKIFEKSALNFWVGLFCLFGFISLLRGASFFGTDYAANFIFPLKRWLTPFFLFFITLNIVKNKEHLKTTLVIILIAVAIVGLMAVKDYIDIGDASSIDKSRVSGVMGNPNMLGAFFVYYMFIFAAFWLFNLRKFAFWLLIIPFLICFRGIQVTFSRGAYIAFAFGGLALAFFRSKGLFVLCTAFIVLAMINPVLLPAGIRHRMGSTFKGGELYSTDINEIKDKSVTQRITIWKGGLEMIKDHPLLGTGYGAFPYLISFYAPLGKFADAHNSYITIAAEMGIPALIVFLVIIFVLFKKTLWLYRNTQDKFIKALSLGVLAGIAGLLMANMFGSRLVEQGVSSYFWILAGLIMRAVIMERKNKRFRKLSAVNKVRSEYDG